MEPLKASKPIALVEQVTSLFKELQSDQKRAAMLAMIQEFGQIPLPKPTKPKARTTKKITNLDK